MHLRLTLHLALILACLFQTVGLDTTLADRIQLRKSNNEAIIHEPAAETPKELHGEILIEAQDGGVLFQRNDGQLMILQADCLLYTSPSPRDKRQSRMPSSA